MKTWGFQGYADYHMPLTLTPSSSDEVPKLQQEAHPSQEYNHQEKKSIPAYEVEISKASELSPHSCQNGYHKKRTQMTNVGKDMEEREPSYTIGGIVNWYSHYGQQYGDFSKN